MLTHIWTSATLLEKHTDVMVDRLLPSEHRTDHTKSPINDRRIARLIETVGVAPVHLPVIRLVYDLALIV